MAKPYSLDLRERVVAFMMGGKRRDAPESQRDRLLKQVKNHPDLTLDALLRQPERRRCKVCRNTLWRFFTC